ncbi:MAG TPA: carboxypeptidase-like regulatory domain-containing protein, partial [Chitinophagaceae bacterium]|nr:carboxypeptidase-like regulatory domain-containing protein [Chitinophagaceae bacterium]
MRRLLCVMLGMLVLSTQLLAQNRPITGRITTAQGSPVVNASVTVKGTNIGTTTSSEGTFSLSVPSSATTLVVSSVGYQDQEIRLGTENEVNLTLSAREQA